MKLSKSTLQAFEVGAKPGNAEELKPKLSDTSVYVVNGKPGNPGYFFGENLSSDENDLVFISVLKAVPSNILNPIATWFYKSMPAPTNQ